MIMRRNTVQRQIFLAALKRVETLPMVKEVYLKAEKYVRFCRRMIWVDMINTRISIAILYNRTKCGDNRKYTWRRFL